MSEWSIYGESDQGQNVDIHDRPHHAVVLGLPPGKAEQIVEAHNAALEAVNDRERLLGLIDGIGRIAERRMGICPLCDEHWNRHGMACPVRPALDAAPAVAGEAVIIEPNTCDACNEVIPDGEEYSHHRWCGLETVVPGASDAGDGDGER